MSYLEVLATVFVVMVFVFNTVYLYRDKKYLPYLVEKVKGDIRDQEVKKWQMDAIDAVSDGGYKQHMETVAYNLVRLEKLQTQRLDAGASLDQLKSVINNSTDTNKPR